MRKILAAIVIVGFFGTASRTMAQMSSANYEIRWDTVGAGGDDISSSSSYILRDTIGSTAPGGSSGTSYELEAGYRAGINSSFIDFSFFSQDNSTVEDATALAGNTISCASDLYSVGDMVALVQDRGAMQVSVIGQIISKDIGTITVDELQPAGVVPLIDGDNDYVYRLDGTSVDLGTINSSSVSTSIVGIQVSSGSDGGYAVMIASDGNLHDGATAIQNVSDGSVTAGAEEYGARSSDSSLADSTFDTMDSPLTDEYQDIADTSTPATNARALLTLKGSIDGGTPNGSYSQTLTLIASATY